MRNVSLALALALASACGPSATHPAAAPRVATPLGPRITSEDQYDSARADYDALDVADPLRAGRRLSLEAWLQDQLVHALDGGHLEEGYDTFKQALTLYDAGELRGAIEDPALAADADRIERAYRRRGAHEEVTVALIAEISLEPAARAAATQRYRELTAWMRSAAGDDPAAEIEGEERVIQDLEAAAHLWPSPFLVDELSARYLDRHTSGSMSAFDRRVRRGADLRELLSGSPRAGVAYELARLYLRISDLQAAKTQLDKLAGQPGDDPALRALVDKVAGASSQPADFIGLAEKFAEQGRDDRDVSLRICRDAARRFPQAPEPRLWAGKFALSLEQLGVALQNFEAAVRLDPTRFDGWESLAKLYQVRLFQLASDENLNVSALEAQLARVQTFHAEAEKRFPGKPLKPSMADALFEVGRGYYNAGRLPEAVRYLERTVTMAPTAGALELLGEIKLKQGDGRAAAVLLARAADLPKSDPGEQLWWLARLRRPLADAVEASGDPSGAVKLRHAALEDWNKLISIGLVPEAGAEAAIERAKILYQLGDRDGALDGFDKAIDTAPDRGPTYADVIAFLVGRGELEAALDAYHRALGRSEVSDYLKVYCSLWIVDLARRAGQPEDPLAAAYLKSTDGAKWYDDLARWYTGRESETQLLSRADTPARKAESSFYRAMRALSTGKPDEARRLWHQVLGTDMMAFFEYDMAQLYLKLGSAPAHPLLTSTPAPAPPPPAANHPPDGSI
ncbi:MAG TPA: hypothetical protein VII38_05820 [Polyangia bacterium]|jgi:tetratricopeptide (TPR) repeat protein